MLGEDPGSWAASSRARRSLYQRMGNIAKLISDPSDTGKELLALSIDLARYIPFDPGARRFAEDFAGSFYARSWVCAILRDGQAGVDGPGPPGARTGRGPPYWTGE